MIIRSIELRCFRIGECPVCPRHSGADTRPSGTRFSFSWSKVVVCYHVCMAILWSTLYKQYRGKWLALDDDETTVLANGATAREALRLARESGYPNPILTLMPESLNALVGDL